MSMLYEREAEGSIEDLGARVEHRTGPRLWPGLTGRASPRRTSWARSFQGRHVATIAVQLKKGASA